jgi:hypothetical protein
MEYVSLRTAEQGALHAVRDLLLWVKALVSGMCGRTQLEGLDDFRRANLDTR